MRQTMENMFDQHREITEKKFASLQDIQDEIARRWAKKMRHFESPSTRGLEALVSRVKASLDSPTMSSKKDFSEKISMLHKGKYICLERNLEFSSTR